MKPDRAYTPARRAPKTPCGLAAPTPSRLTRMKSRDDDSSSNTSANGSDEVAVYCRLRPLDETRLPNEYVPSVQNVDEKTVRLIPPESSRAFANGKQTNYSFRGVFGGNCAQKEVFDAVALPLVKELLQEKNGLLFTYGVTGSGKTHTMQGSPQDGGVMSRAIDVIFNSLHDRLVARKHMIVPDRLNDFQVQSLADAAMTEQAEMIRGRCQGSRFNRINSESSDHQNLSNRLPDPTSLDDEVEKNRTFAVFISYFEIYNTYIYDLLEDTRDPVTGRPRYETKFLREDSYGNMFVLGCTELEVRSPKEALEAFHRGQKRRRVAQTQLNHESSRSHAVFNIRLVKTCPAGDGEIDLDKPCMVSQLALVDLAGSERTNRTGNKGQALREAGRINNSLMNLRRCIEKLRENQRTGRTGAVPYRDDKLTHLFRNYFEGIGSVKMVVCVNPREQDFDENVNVMQFAEIASEVHIERIDPVPRELALTPGQRRAKQAIEEAMGRAAHLEADPANAVYSPIYSLGPDWPSMSDDDQTLDALVPFLERRIATRNTLVDDFAGKQEAFRKKLVQMEKELILVREENSKLKSCAEGDKRHVRELEGRLVNAEAANNSLQRRVGAFSNARVTLENELDEKERLLNEQKKDQKKTTKKYRQHLLQQEQVNTELAYRLKEQQTKQEKFESEKAKLRSGRNVAISGTPTRSRATTINKIPSNPDFSTTNRTPSAASSRKPLVPSNRSDDDNNLSTLEAPEPRRSVAVSNPRHRRSQSAGANWVNHQPAQQIPLNTIMQPTLRRSVSKVTEKDIVNNKVNKYCLTTQSQDTDGELETKIFKGDVIPTSTGGRQVVFDDVEVFRQESPVVSPVRSRRSKRSYEEFMGVGSRIAALEDRMNDVGRAAKKYRV